jgi:4-hydroxy-tetrahydrodipicolinate synthase
VVSNVIPKQMTELVRAGLDRDFSTCREIHRRWLPLMDIVFVESNPIPVKAALAAMGLLQAVYRLPLVSASDANQARIQDTLRAGGLI